MEAAKEIPIENLISAVNILYNMPAKYFTCYPKDLNQLKKIESELWSSVGHSDAINPDISKEILNITNRVADCLFSLQ